MSSSQQQGNRIWVYGAVPLALFLVATVWVLGGWLTAFVLACGWLAESLVAHWTSRRTSGADRALRVDDEAWASLQVACLGGGFVVAGAYYLMRGVELPVEDPSLIKWLLAISPILAAYFAFAAGSLWISTILLGRYGWWAGSDRFFKFLSMAGLGFMAVTWPLLAVGGPSVVDENFLLIGGLGSGAAVISLGFVPSENSKD